MLVGGPTLQARRGNADVDAMSQQPSEAPALPPAAWYPDPSGVGEMRYWNGTAWTPGVVIAGQVTERAMPWPPVRSTPPPDDRPELPARAAGYGLAGFLVGLVLAVALGLLAHLAGLPDIAVLAVNSLGLWTGLLAACWRASRRYGTGNVLRDFGLRLSGADVSWGLLMSIAARVAGAFVLVPFVFGDREFLGTNRGTFGDVDASAASFLAFSVIAVVGAPIVEELFFRGLLLRSLSSAIGVGGAIATQAALFGLAHLNPVLGKANVSVMLVITTAGVVFGVTAWWRRVGTSVAAHGFYNLVAVAVAAFAA